MDFIVSFRQACTARIFFKPDGALVGGRGIGQGARGNGEGREAWRPRSIGESRLSADKAIMT